MNVITIAIQKCHALVLEGLNLNQSEPTKNTLVLTLNAKMMELGFIMSQDLYQQLCQMKPADAAKLGEKVIPVLQKLKGSHIQHKPMYPNFPDQVINASDAELYFNAIFHYYSFGEWMPGYNLLPRKFTFENIKFQEITAINSAKFLQVFTTLLLAQDSLSDEDKGIIQWFMEQDNANQLRVPEDIPFHENMCVVAAKFLQDGHDIKVMVKNATDILRIATFISGGDVSLAENTRFKSLPRSQRRVLTKQLERVINEEDIGRHRNKWVRLFHNLHVGDYSTKVFDIAKKARNNGRLKSFYSDLEAALLKLDIDTVLSLLSSRAGEFGRRLDHVLRVAMDADMKLVTNPKAITSFKDLNQKNRYQQQVITAFLNVIDKIPTRNLTQLYGHLNSRGVDTVEKIIFPKGSFQNAVVVEKYLAAMDFKLLQALKEGIQNSLQQRFTKLDALGKVWIDPVLIESPLPNMQRSASSGLFNMARGTRLSIKSEQDTLRLFVYWKGQDIDLSATFHDETGQMTKQVSYTDLRSDKYQTYHSGDITRAPNGASEFIDINIPGAARHARYLAMNVLVYSGPNFDEHTECFVGWMTREHSNSNEIFDPATVQQKVDLKQSCRNVVPVIFDLVERKAIWVDLPTSRNGFYAQNNVQNNRASIQQKLIAMINVSNKLSLYELFELHGKARGEMVETREEADIVFALDGDVTPFDVNVINAEYLI
ncbi:MAG: hypothetical protein L3J59_02740 [Methylococcaceae bacterium]|nr:hypothetical protein [Methylococcaceae bacterium]